MTERMFGWDSSHEHNRRTQRTVSQHSEDTGSSIQDNDGLPFNRHLITETEIDVSVDSASVRSGDELLESSSQSGGRRLENGSIINSNRSVLSRGESLQQSSLTLRSSSSRQTVPSQSGGLSVLEGPSNEDLLERLPNNQTMLKIVVLGGPKTGKTTFARNFIAESDLVLDEDESNGSTRREHFERYAVSENAAVEIWVGPSIYSNAKEDYIRKIKEDIKDWHEDHVLFVILSKDDVNETDEFLAKKLTDFWKIFFFVRTHFDTVFQPSREMDAGEQRYESLEYNAQGQVKGGIRERLEKFGIESNGFEVFVINCKKEAEWDFRELKRRLCEEAEVVFLKRKAFAYKEQRLKILGPWKLWVFFHSILFCFVLLLFCGAPIYIREQLRKLLGVLLVLFPVVCVFATFLSLCRTSLRSLYDILCTIAMKQMMTHYIEQ